VLAVIGGPGVTYLGGVALFGLVYTALFDSANLWQPLLFFAVPLLFLAGLSTLIVFVRSRGNPGAIGFRRVAVGTLALAGAIALVGLLLLLSAEVFLFIVCHGP
jgi:hypothetical protein